MTNYKTCSVVSITGGYRICSLIPDDVKLTAEMIDKPLAGETKLSERCAMMEFEFQCLLLILHEGHTIDENQASQYERHLKKIQDRFDHFKNKIRDIKTGIDELVKHYSKLHEAINPQSIETKHTQKDSASRTKDKEPAPKQARTRSKRKNKTAGPLNLARLGSGGPNSKRTRRHPLSRIKNRPTLPKDHVLALIKAYEHLGSTASTGAAAPPS